MADDAPAPVPPAGAPDQLPPDETAPDSVEVYRVVGGSAAWALAEAQQQRRTITLAVDAEAFFTTDKAVARAQLDTLKEQTGAAAAVRVLVPEASIVDRPADRQHHGAILVATDGTLEVHPEDISFVVSIDRPRGARYGA